MTSTEQPHSRVITVDVRTEDGDMLIGTSPQLPGLLAVATSDRELTEELPGLIGRFCLVRFGQRVSVHHLRRDGTLSSKRYAIEWALVPMAA